MYDFWWISSNSWKELTKPRLQDAKREPKKKNSTEFSQNEGREENMCRRRIKVNRLLGKLNSSPAEECSLAPVVIVNNDNFKNRT